jgi:hypothetical protein
MNATASKGIAVPQPRCRRSTGEKLTRWFVTSAGVILALTGVGKLVSASGNSRILDSSDPIFAISFRHLMLSLGLLELAVSAICLLTRRRKLALLLVAWLASNFLLYRAGLWFMGWSVPCNCLGNLTDALHLSPKIAETTAQIIAVYLLAGSVASVLRLRRSLLRPSTGVGA